MSRDARPERHILVIGGAGYIGSVLVRRLLARGYRVRCLDALLYETGGAIAALLEHSRFSFVRGDMRHPDALADGLTGVTDVVLLASLVGDAICNKYPELARDINVTGSVRVLEALEARAIDRFVYVSTCSNYGAHGDALATEESAVDPRSIYADTKVAFEQFLLARTAALSSAPTILRLATAYGLSPRMRFDLTISDFARELALGRELVVYDPDTWRPYCHVEDISSAVVAVLEADRAAVTGQVFNVGGDTQNYTKAMIVAELTAILPAAAVRWRSGGVDVRNYRVSFAKIRSTLGFLPEHAVRQSLSAVARAVRCGLYPDVDARPAFYGNRLIVHEPTREDP